jgi:class 3 adenylate cyclase
MGTVDKLYRRIDRLTDQHLVEKIKTVGDVYMAATGIPNQTDVHALIMADFCFDVAEVVRLFSIKQKLALSFKIGVSSGPIVAGVIGKNKFTYDLWGDAANTASRMYSFGKKGKIQTTISTVRLIETHYRCSKANNGEKMNVKGKGLMMCYYIDGRLPSYPASERMSTSAKVERIAEKYLMKSDKEKDDDQFAQRLKGGVTSGVGKDLWVPDGDRDCCMECEKKFTFLFRRHHCRYCGRLLCQDCTTKKLYKDRACDRCFDVFQDQAMRNVLLHLAKVRRIQEKQGKAHNNFKTPYSAMYHCCRSGTSRSLEFEYLVKRKTAVRTLLLYSWFTVLLLLIFSNHVINDFLLPFRCVNTTSGKSTDCDKFDVPTSGTGTFGGTGQNVFYTSQTVSDFMSNEHKLTLAKSLDDVAQSHSVNITAKLEQATAKAIAAKAESDAAAAKAGQTIDSAPAVGPTTWTTIMATEQYALPFFGIFDDNTIVAVSYTHLDSQAVPEYGVTRLMYAKTLLSFGVVPMVVCFILVSMMDYNISGDKEFEKHMSADTTRDPGKPAPGMYTKEDHKWIGIQLAVLLSIMIALGVCLAAQSAFGGGTYHGYLFLFVVWVTNICNDVPAFYCSVVTLIWTFSYLGMIIRNDIDVSGMPNTKALTENGGISVILTFFVEKFIPVAILALLGGRKLEEKTRFQFTKQLNHRDTIRSTMIEERKNNELIPLPLPIRKMLEDADTQIGGENTIVIDAFGSVLFADIVSFTVYSSNMDPMKLVHVLNEMFSMHDTLATRMGVDKIKTLGDCYVAATGLLAPSPNHASLLVKFGIGMHDVMDKLNTKFDIHGKGPAGKDLRIRVGIATGTVVGGVVGLKKFLFDIWGDTVEVSCFSHRWCVGLLCVCWGGGGSM